ncbi:hypothetical protein HELRODRAFT_191318 [Helobdella robusta]|uniref:Uncharacterized protein n=1 Tax=Helobdella robusta TaxID=6412 RepID=T1FSV7_HELRO|nr:hypothetical protein HELRODRAFT_191318 [Helobdella robusta]ESO05503.1 hypothetical protein HELRODRAFT_191318 [Helobdella robusta]
MFGATVDSHVMLTLKKFLADLRHYKVSMNLKTYHNEGLIIYINNINNNNKKNKNNNIEDNYNNINKNNNKKIIRKINNNNKFNWVDTNENNIDDCQPISLLVYMKLGHVYIHLKRQRHFYHHGDVDDADDDGGDPVYNDDFFHGDDDDEDGVNLKKSVGVYNDGNWFNVNLNVNESVYALNINNTEWMSVTANNNNNHNNNNHNNNNHNNNNHNNNNNDNNNDNNNSNEIRR